MQKIADKKAEKQNEITPKEVILPQWIENLFALPSVSSDTSGFMALF